MLTVEDLVATFESKGRRGARTAEGGEREQVVVAVGGVTFSVAEGEMFSLLGPSGCGKTTTLRSIAGLETPRAGRIKLGERTLFSKEGRVNVPANARNLGMVFQSYAIWPHMSVYRNVSFPLEVSASRRRQSNNGEIQRKVHDILDVMGLARYAERAATDLSGGEQQRLALARAMIIEPSLMLLDEPLSNLDAQLRTSMRLELKRLQREHGLTALYVTHDQSEALVLSDRIAVMKDGTIMQVGSPETIYRRPANLFVAEFVGTTNMLPGVVKDYTKDLVEIETSAGSLLADRGPAALSNRKVFVSIRPESFQIAEEDEDHVEGSRGEGRSGWHGSVVIRAFEGNALEYVIAVGDHELRVRCNPRMSIPSPARVRLTVQPNDVAIIAADE